MSVSEAESVGDYRSPPDVPSAQSHNVGASTAGRHKDIFEIAERFGLIMVLALEVVVFCALRPSTFASVANFQTIGISVSVLAVAATALMIPLVGGRFDVSVGANLGLCDIAASSMMSRYHVPLGLAIVATAGIGSLLGLVNGAIVAYFGVNSIITTIGTSTVMGGIVQAYTGGVPVNVGISTTLTNLSRQRVVGIPALFLVMLFICVCVWFILTQTPFGRRLQATGSNLNAARLNGFYVQRIVMTSFVIAGCLSGLAGVMEVAAEGSGDPTAGGLQFVLPALAAVFLGATTLQPGRYNVPGTLLALIFISTTISGLILVGLKPWVTDVFDGSAVVIAIAFSAQLKRRRTGSIDISVG